MKVGIFIQNLNAKSGGRATLINEIIQPLNEVTHESKHKYFILSPQKDLKAFSKEIQIIPIHLSLAKIIVHKIYYTFIGIIQKVLFPKTTFKVKNIYENPIVNSSVDLMWYLDTYCPTTEVPYILTVLDVEHRNEPFFPEVSSRDRWTTRENDLANKIRQAALVITGTEAGKNEIMFFYQIPDERIKVIPFPTPRLSLDDRKKEAKIKSANLPENYLFYPAQFWPHKNHVGLLYALKVLKEKWHICIPVVFVGSDKENNQLYIKKLVEELDLKSQVLFLGFVDTNELVTLYKNAFALIYPTFFGPDNLPPLEAFSLGCPVIASKVAGSEEQLGEAALLVDPTSAEQIASAIKLLYNDPTLRQKLIQKGFERAAKWTGHDYVQRIFKLIDEFEIYRRCWK